MKQFRQYFFIILLGLTTILFGYNYFYRPFEKKQEVVLEGVSGSAQMVAESRTPQDILLELTAEQRILQMLAAPVTVGPDFVSVASELVADDFFNQVPQATLAASNTTNATNSANLRTVTNLLETNSPESFAATSAAVEKTALEDQVQKFGFFVLFGKSITMNQVKQVVGELHNTTNVLELKPLIAVDHEGGTVQRLSGEGFTKLDSWRKICSLTTTDREEILKQSAHELKEAGIDIVLAPVLDVGNSQILKDRVCSIDSYAIVADRSMDFVTIFSDLGILPVIKHFPGIGLATKDLHNSYDYISVLENDVKLYKYIIDQVKHIGVMTAHVGVVSQDRTIPCSVSPYCVSELNTAYPEVLVFTDALEMVAASYDKDNPRVPKDLIQISKEAILAGNNVLLYGASVSPEELENIATALLTEYEQNPKFRALVDQSVLKIIEYKGL